MSQIAVSIIRRHTVAARFWDVFVSGNLAGTIGNVGAVPTPSLAQRYRALDFNNAVLDETRTEADAANLIINNFIANPPS